MQVGQRQTTPWGAQHAQPGQSIGWMQQGPTQLAQILNQWMLTQGFHFDGFEWQTIAAQSAGDGKQMLMAATEHGDRLIAIGQRLLNQTNYRLRFVFRVFLRVDETMTLHGGVSQRRFDCLCAGKAHGTAQTIIASGEQIRPKCIDPLHQSSLTAEIALQRQGI